MNPETHYSSHGLLVNIEGIDGSGKSTLIHNVHALLTATEQEVILTKEPGGTELGIELKKILQQKDEPIGAMTEFLLFATDRAQHFEQIVMPALVADKIVISDRMADSSLAYQGYGRGVDTDMITLINAWAMRNIAPDITIYVMLDPETAFTRFTERGSDLSSFEKEKKEFWQRVISGYETIFAKRKNVIQLDGTLAPDTIAQQACEAIINARATKQAT